MMIGTGEVVPTSDSQTIQANDHVAEFGDQAGVLVPTRRHEVRVKEQKVCTYELCELIDDDSAVTHQGEAYSLNRSTHGILILMGQEPQAQQLIELHIPESKWRRSYNLYEVQWAKPLHVESQGDLFLVGCRLTFGPSRYWAF